MSISTFPAEKTPIQADNWVSSTQAYTIMSHNALSGPQSTNKRRCFLQPPWKKPSPFRSLYAPSWSRLERTTCPGNPIIDPPTSETWMRGSHEGWKTERERETEREPKRWKTYTHESTTHKNNKALIPSALSFPLNLTQSFGNLEILWPWPWGWISLPSLASI